MKYLLIILSVFFTTSVSLAEQFNLGVVIPLSGAAAEGGNACKNGMELAYQKLNEQDRSALHLIFEDDGNEPKKTVSAFAKLRASPGIHTLVTWASTTSNAVAPIAEQNSIPMIAVATDPRIVSGRRWVFNFWVTPEEEAKVVAQELKRRNWTKVARISSIQEGLQAVKVAFDRASKSTETLVVVDEDYPLDAKDFRPFLLKLKKYPELQGVFVNLYFGQVGAFARQARELGLNIPLFNVETFEDLNQVKVSQGALIDQWYVQADDASSEFMKSYAKTYPSASNYSAGNCHDLVLIISQALREGRAFNGFNNYLSELKNFKGVMGSYSATGDNRFSLPATVKVVRHAGFEKLGF